MILMNNEWKQMNKMEFNMSTKQQKVKNLFVIHDTFSWECGLAFKFIVHTFENTFSVFSLVYDGGMAGMCCLLVEVQRETLCEILVNYVT